MYCIGKEMLKRRTQFYMDIRFILSAFYVKPSKGEYGIYILLSFTKYCCPNQR